MTENIRKKVKILIAYSKMIVGGSTTSLLSLLSLLDPEKYCVDLLLYDRTGVLQSAIPEWIHVLDYDATAKQYDCRSAIAFAKSRMLSVKHNNKLLHSQVMSQDLARRMKQVEGEYDCAIAYLEFLPSWLVFGKVSAHRKVYWIHTDYKQAGLIYAEDEIMYSSADKIVLVSEACANNFIEQAPALRDKVCCIRNILSKRTVLALSDEPIEWTCNTDDGVRIVTVARLLFNTKGHDRGLRMLSRIKNDYPDFQFHWYVIGDGEDRDRFTELVKAEGMEDHVSILGEIPNPHPYLKHMDVFFLPSYYEGKPMAVTEAQMHAVVPLVAEYPAAHDQIEDGIDGIIAANSEEGIFQKLCQLVQGKIDLTSMKEAMRKKDYSNLSEVEKIYRTILIDEGENI